MGDDNINIRRASAEISGDSFEGVHVASVKIGMSLNESPTYTVTPVPNRSRDRIVSRVTDAALIKYYGQLQESKTIPPGVNAVKLTLFDGNTTIITSDAIFISPETSLGAESYAILMNFVGELALLDAFRPDIYDSYEFNNYFGTTPGKENLNLKTLVASASTPTSYLNSVLKEMRRLWETATRTGTSNPTYRPEDAALIKKIHANNLIPGVLLDGILNRSTGNSPAFKLLSSAESAVKLPIQMHVVRIIADMLRHSTGGFLQTLLYFAYTFDLVMVPNINGNTASFISTDELSTSEPEERVVTIVAFSPRLGRSTLSPVNAVIVRGSMQYGFKTGLRSGARTLSDAGQILGVWPEDALGSGNSGIPVTTQPPAWVPPNAPPSGNTRKVINQSLTGKRPSATEVRKAHELGLKTYGGLCGEIMTATAKSRYIDAALQSDTVSITVPLDFSWELGKRYSIRGRIDGESSEFLFDGALASLSHALERPQQPGGSGTALTSLSFSHVEMGAYNLRSKT